MKRSMKKKRKTGEEVAYWQSYSDMMAALLLVFVLIITFTILSAQKKFEENQAALEEQRLIIEEQQRKAESQQKQIEEQQKKVEQLIGVKTSLIGALKDEFENTDLSVSIDENTGTITFDSNVLFAVNSDELKPASIELLQKFLPKYFSVLLDPDFKEYVAEIIIEGHTARSSDYLLSLDLSQRRALSVANFALREGSTVIPKEQLEELRKIVTANGRSFSTPIFDFEGNYDGEASRRVEIKFRLKDDEMIQEMIQALEGNIQ